MKVLKIILLALIFCFFSCKEEFNKPITKGEKPSMISDYTVNNLAGAVEVSYKIPDNNVAYVVAEYEIKPGVKMEARSSKYKNRVLLEGFPAKGEYQVELISVGRDEQRSESTIIVVKPETPPLIKTFQTLKVQADFGGLNIQAENEDESDLVYEILIKDENKEWKVAEQFYSSMRDVNFSVRGLPSIKEEFGVFIRDRWLNYTDTLESELTPFNEIEVDMSNFYETNFPGDSYQMHQVGAARKMAWLFDGRKGTQTQGYYSLLNTGMPQHFTIFLQDTYKLSRIKLYQHVSIANSSAYNSANPKRFRVWGSMEPNPDGSFDESWYLLSEFEGVKPSGLPTGTNTDEDNNTAKEGDEYTFDIDVPPARYIRVQTLETWGNTQHVFITEMEIFGDFFKE